MDWEFRLPVADSDCQTPENPARLHGNSTYEVVSFGDRCTGLVPYNRITGPPRSRTCARHGVQVLPVNHPAGILSHRHPWWPAPVLLKQPGNGLPAPRLQPLKWPGGLYAEPATIRRDGAQERHGVWEIAIVASRHLARDLQSRHTRSPGHSLTNELRHIRQRRGLAS